jgi:hypothetical protein
MPHTPLLPLSLPIFQLIPLLLQLPPHLKPIPELVAPEPAVDVHSVHDSRRKLIPLFLQFRDSLIVQAHYFFEGFDQCGWGVSAHVVDLV